MHTTELFSFCQLYLWEWWLGTWHIAPQVSLKTWMEPVAAIHMQGKSKQLYLLVPLVLAGLFLHLLNTSHSSPAFSLQALSFSCMLYKN